MLNLDHSSNIKLKMKKEIKNLVWLTIGLILIRKSQVQTNNCDSSGFPPYGNGSVNRYRLDGSLAFPQIISYGNQTQSAMVARMTHRF